MAARADKIAWIAIIAAILVGISIQIAGYWPGIMNYDSIRQYEQALSGQYDDWHPPVMDWVWRQFLPIHHGPAPFFAFQMLLYWGGFAIWSRWALKRGRRGLAFAIVGCSLLPVCFALIGAMIKDSVMAGSLAVAAGLLAWIQSAGDPGADKPPLPVWLLRAIAIILVLFAATMRFNAFVATVPLFVALMPANWRNTPARLALTTIVSAVPLLLAVPVANRTLHADHSGVELSLVIFDLAGITEYSEVDAFPPLGVSDPVNVVDNCYSTEKWDPFAWWGDQPCAIGFNNFRAYLQKTGKSAIGLWLSAIVAHPLAYAEHRIRHFNSNLYFLVRPADYDDDNSPAFSQSDPNPWHYSITPNQVEATIEQIVLAATQTPIGWPIWWMALTAGVLILSPGLQSRRIIVPVALSALLYGLGYLVVSVASEMRYHSWTMTAGAIVVVIAASDIANGAPVSRRRLALAVAPAVIVAVMGIGWRVAPFV